MTRLDAIRLLLKGTELPPPKVLYADADRATVDLGKRPKKPKANVAKFQKRA